MMFKPAGKGSNFREARVDPQLSRTNLEYVLQKNKRFSTDGQSTAQSYKPMRYGDNTVLDCSQHPEEDLQPTLREEVETAVAALKKGKSAEFVQAGGETMI